MTERHRFPPPASGLSSMGELRVVRGGLQKSAPKMSSQPTMEAGVNLMAVLVEEAA